MARKTNWRDLRVGLFALAALALGVLAILVFARIGGVRGKKATLYVTASTATGVLKGSDVHVAGKRVGVVDDIRFRPVAADTSVRLVMEVSVLESALPLVRRNSTAQIRPSGTIIGAPIVAISAGSSDQPQVRPGDTVHSQPQVAAQGIAARVASLGVSMGGLMKDWRSVTADVRSARGTFGAARIEGPADLGAFKSRTATLISRLSGRQGTLGLAMHDPALGARAAAVAASMDSLGTFLSTPTGNIGRFRRDSTLATQMTKTRAALDSVRAALADTRGTAGRMGADRALSEELDGVRREMDRLIADFKKNPSRYIAF